MPFYRVPMTMTADVDVFAPNASTARREALRLMEEATPSDGFLDGWNSVQAERGEPIIDRVSGFGFETIDLDEVETLPQRWRVEPQRDARDSNPVAVSHIYPVDDEHATAWAVIEHRDDTTDMVETYPTRAAAEAAVRALEAGQPLPDPEWDTPEEPATPAALIADALVLLDGVNDATDDNGRVFAYLADGRVLRITAEVVEG